MRIVDLNKDWRLIKASLPKAFQKLPSDFESVSLPFDILTKEPRLFSLPQGSFNSYCDSMTIDLFKQLPKISKIHKAFFDLQGTAGVCELSLNGDALKTISNPARSLTDITHALLGGDNLLRLNLGCYADSGKYTGLGIASTAKLLLADNPVYFSPYSAFVKTDLLSAKAQLSVSVEITNDLETAAPLLLRAEVFNEKNKRVVKKLKKTKIPAKSKKVLQLPVKIGRPFEWSSYDPYQYSLALSVFEGDSESGKCLDTDNLRFGISNVAISHKQLKHNNSQLKLKGAVMAHDNGILGNTSELSAEMYKLQKIKDLGFNSVRYIGCPSDAALQALDLLGMFAVVDIFASLRQSSFLHDGHLFFDSEWEAIVDNSIKTLRNHPSVVMYSIADNAPETYNRGAGHELIKKIVARIKSLDATRPITINAFERLPSAAEIAKYDLKIVASSDDAVEKKALSAAREKDLFKLLTDKCFSQTDVAGYSYLHPRYMTDKNIADRVIVGLATMPEKAFDALEETDKNPAVIGDFLFAGADFLGQPYNSFTHSHHNFEEKTPANYSGGLLDITYRKKDMSYYNEILLGKKNCSHILVQNPEALEDGSDAEFTAENTTNLWNWPRHVGKPIKIRVISSADIVALFLDGRAVGRKLAGKFNKYIADFKTNFYPGVLEAVSYHKGVEQSRERLESVTSPKAIKIDCSSKAITPNELSFVDIRICDKEGRLVPFAARDVEVSVSGEGELVAIGNGDPESFHIQGKNSCAVFGGVATAVIRGTSEGKVIVKAVSEGLLPNKATIKVKPSKH